MHIHNSNFMLILYSSLLMLTTWITVKIYFDFFHVRI